MVRKLPWYSISRRNDAKKNKLKKALRNPKKYVKSKKVGYKGVATQAKKRQMLKDAADGANLYSQTRAVEIFESYFKDDLETMTEDFVFYARSLAARQIEPGMKKKLYNGKTNY